MALLRFTEERPDDEIQKTLQATIQSAREEFAPLAYEGEYPESGFGIQIIRPRHVGMASDKWQMTITTAYADWINKTLGTNNFLVVTGVFNLTIDPQTVEIFPSANGKDLPIIQIENLYALDEGRGWFSKPFAVRPSNNVTIQAIGKAAGTERLGLLGYCVGKRSFLINKTAT